MEKCAVENLVALCYKLLVEIVYLPSAAKAMRRLDPVVRKRIEGKVEAYSADPASLHNMVTRMQGLGAEFLRLKVGDYRVIFSADGVILAVHKVGHRGEIYR